MSSEMEWEEEESDSEKSVDSLISAVVMYVIHQDETRQPIKRADIVKHALPSNSKKYKMVMAQANKFMEHALGLTLVDLDGTDKQYITISKFQEPSQKKALTSCVDTQYRRSLLLIVLSYIFMESNTITDEKLWKLLTQLKIIKSSITYVHPTFGNVRRLCTTDFVRQMYLKVEKISQKNPPQVMFSWGPRAHAEFSKREVLNFVAKMQSDVNPEKFTLQWAQMLKEEDGEEAEEEEDFVETSQAPVPKKRARVKTSR